METTTNSKMSTDSKKSDFDTDEIVKRLLEAIVKRIEGGDDPRRKYDYLAKLDDETVQTLSTLTDNQIDSVAECAWLASAFPSMGPLDKFGNTLAHWSPSKQGKRADQITATMINQQTHVIPTLLNQPSQPNNKKEKSKETKDGEK